MPSRQFIPLALLLAASSAYAQSAAPASLSKRLPEIKFEQIALTDALDFFRDSTDANFVVDWKALQEVGVGRETPLTLRLRGIATGVALRKTLEAAAPGLLTWYIDQNVIHITTKLVADARLITRVYPVQDLVMDVPNFTDAPELSLSSNSGGGSRSSGSRGGGGGSGGSGNLFGGGTGTGNTTARKSTRQRGEELVELITAIIRPEVWTVNGGKSSIRYQGGRLIVTAPLAVHEMIGG